MRVGTAEGHGVSGCNRENRAAMGIRAARGESRCSRGWPRPGAVGLSLHRVSPCGRAMNQSPKRTIGSICCVHHRRGGMRRSQCCVEVKRRTSSVSELSPIAARGRVAGKPGKTKSRDSALDLSVREFSWPWRALASSRVRVGAISLLLPLCLERSPPGDPHAVSGHANARARKKSFFSAGYPLRPPNLDPTVPGMAS